MDRRRTLDGTRRTLIVGLGAAAAGTIATTFGTGLGRTLGMATTVEGPAARMMVGGNHVQMASTAFATDAAYMSQRSRQLVGFATGAPMTVQALFTNSINVAGQILTTDCTPLPVETFGFVCNGAATPATIAGQGARTFAIGETALTDRMEIAAAPAGTPVFFETVITFEGAPGAERWPGIRLPYNATAALGEGFQNAASSLAGAFGEAIGNGSPRGGPFGVCGFFVETASRGRAVLKVNDSIGAGASAAKLTYDARGNIGFLQQMLDSEIGSRLPYWDVGMDGASLLAAQPSNDAKSVFEWVEEVCGLLGNVPFDIVANQLAHNDMGQGSMTAFKASFNRCRDFVRTNLGDPRWVQFGITGRTTSTDLWTTEAGQVPHATGGATQWAAGGLMEQARDWFAQGADGQIDAYVPHHEAIHAGFVFREPAFKGTLAVALEADASSTAVLLPDGGSAIPAVGETLVFDPDDTGGGADGSNVRKVYTVATVTDNGAAIPGTYACTFLDNTDTALTVRLAHRANTIVRGSATPDGEHFPGSYHALMRDHALTFKAAALGTGASEPTFDMSFDEAVASLGLVPTEDMTFGTDAGNSIRNPTQLAAKWFPLEGQFDDIEGEFEADGVTPKLRHLGGAGATTINAETQNYRKSFWADRGDASSPNHVFEADGLRLQATKESDAVLSVYLVGEIDPAGGGFWVNLPAGGRFTEKTYSDAGVLYWTSLSDIGLTVEDMAGVEIGDIVTRAGSALCAVKDIDTTGTRNVVGATRAEGEPRILFEAVTGSGGMFGYLRRFQLSFTKFQFAEIASDIPAPGTGKLVRTVSFKRPLPSNVKVGSTPRGALRGATTGFLNLQNRSGSKILTIAPDRLSCTFDLPLLLAGQRTMDGANHDGLVFMPGLWSGEAWYRKPVGPRRAGKNWWCADIEVSFPDMPNIAMPPGGYTKASLLAALDAIKAAEDASGKRMAKGFWPAFWTMIFQGHPSGIGQSINDRWKGADGYSHVENDILEIFNRLGNGPKDILTNLHDAAYTREVAPSYPDGAWLKTPAQAGTSFNENKSADTHVFRLFETMCNGRRQRLGTIMGRRKTFHYFGSALRSISHWEPTSRYPDQFGMNVALGGLDGGFPFARFFPHEDADIAASFMRIHRVRFWEI